MDGRGDKGSHRGKGHQEETALAYDRLRHLYEIGTLLARFENLERTIPSVVALVARTLPLKRCIVLLETATPERPRAIVWQREGESVAAMQLCETHARRAYTRFLRSSDGFEANLERARSPQRYVLVPLTVDTTILGAVHLEGVDTFDERDLVFVDAVVSQMANAIDRHAILEARQLASERARATAERHMASAEARRAEAELRQLAAQRAEEMIRDELVFARDVAASLGEGVIAADLEGRITLFNPAAEELVMCKAEEALGRTVPDVVRLRRVERRSSIEDYPFAKVMHAGYAIRSDESLLWSRRRAPFPVSYTCTPLRREGKVFGAVLAFRDIMDVKLAERKQRVLADVSAILASSLEHRETLSALVRFAVPLLADLCFIDEIGEDGTARRLEVIFADPQKQRDLADRLSRFCPGPGWGTPQARVIETGRAMLFHEIADVAAIAHDAEHAEVLRTAGLQSMLVVPLVARGRTLGALTLGAAESDRLYSQSDLDLAEETAHRAAIAIDNARLYERAQRATRSRDELLAVVSHDLKNPLGAILMGVTMMLQSFDAQDGELVKKRLSSIRHAAQRMDRLIQDLLDKATIEAGRLSVELRRVEVAPLLADLLEALSPLATSKAIHIERELPAELPAVAADPARLEQVFANLLGNALKFTPKGGVITIAAECSDRAVVFSVTDTGPGMAQEDLDRLFDRFWQARKTARLGTGLGLFIVKGIIEAHGGRVWAESTQGVGSTFFFEIPILPPELDWLVDDGRRLGELRSEDLRSAIDKHAGPPVDSGRGVALGMRDAPALQLAKHSGFKGNVMGVVSRELRGPLTALELLIERLQRDRDTPPSPSQQRILERMFVAIARMTAQLESILQYGLVQAGQLSTDLRTFDLGTIAREIMEQLRPFAVERRMDMVISARADLPPLCSDLDLVRLIVLHLIANAIKVSDDGAVEISLEASDGEHCIAVKDTGPGIPADQRVRIFEPFTTLSDARLKHVPGLGLGLTLVRDLATALGGRVQLDSELGRGATFTVTLPSFPETVENRHVSLH